MTPLSTALPSPSIEFFGSLQYPLATLGQVINVGLNMSDTTLRTEPSDIQGVNIGVSPINSTGGSGVVGPRVELQGGRPSVRVSSTNAVQGQWFKTTMWAPAWDASVFNAGAFLNPPSVVAIFDFHCAMLGSAFVPGTADETGFAFVPSNAGTFPLVMPGGSSPAGGFGIFVNDDGGGNNQYEFVSYDGGTILQRTVIGSAIVPDVTLWSTFRFTIISAAEGRAANLTLEVNRSQIPGVIGLDFDDVILMRPNTINATATNFGCGQAVGDPLPTGPTVGYRWALFARFGRFTASGAEVQPL